MFASRFRLKLFLAVGLAFCAISFERSCDAQATAGNDSSILPAANLILLDKNGIQIISIPASDAADARIKKRSVPTQRHAYGTPVGVFGGRLLTLYGGNSPGYSPTYSGKLMTVNLKDGTVRVLASNVVKAKYDSGQLYLVSKLVKKTEEHTHKLTHIDLKTLKSIDICKLRGESMMMGGPDFALEVAPDGKTVAVSDMKKPVPPDDIMTRVIFAKAGQTETVKTEYCFRSITIGTGAGFFMKAPWFSWHGNDRLLFAGYSTDGSELKLAPNVRRIPMGGEAMKISMVQVSDGSVSDLCELPKSSFPEIISTSVKDHATVYLMRMGIHDLDIKATSKKPPPLAQLISQILLSRKGQNQFR